MPYPDFAESVRCLDDRRLNKQITEAIQILNAIHNPAYGWQNHPAVNMWRGYERALVGYTIHACGEWWVRGFTSHVKSYLKVFDMVGGVTDYDMPWWMGWDSFHLSHKSNLIRKDPSYYGAHWPCVPDNLPYVWPTRLLEVDPNVES